MTRDARHLIVGLAIWRAADRGGGRIISQFNTAEARQEIGNIVNAVPPIMQGLAGKPVNVETLGGYIQYKYGGFLPLVTGLWSILALSATLAGESRRGSMDLLVAAPLSRRRIAWQKVLGHILMVGVAMAIIGAAIAVAGSAVATLPGDKITLEAAFGFAAWLFLMSVAAGALAFALAPFVGRGSAAGLAGAVMLGGFLLNGYQQAIPELAPFANLTWFGWTTDHIPLANQFDWASLATGRRLRGADDPDRRRSLRPSRPRRHDRHSGAASAIGPAGAEWPHRARDQRTLLDWPVVGHWAGRVRAADRRLGRRLHRTDRRVAGVRARAQRHLPGHQHRHGRRLPAAGLHRIRAGPGRPGGRGPGRRLGFR